MKTLLIISTLVFTVIFSSTSFGEWTKLGKNVIGDTFYVDFERIRKHEGYVYWWDLTDYLKPTKHGILSFKKYRQGDCKLFRLIDLRHSSHIEPMGGGPSGTHSSKNPEWRFPPPNSAIEAILKSVCSR